MQKIIDYIIENELGEYHENEIMRYHTTMRVGGKVALLVIPKDVDSLSNIIKYINKQNKKYFIIGRGSNLIFSDELMDMVIIKINKVINFMEIEETKVLVGAGYSLARLSKDVSKLGLAGLEFAGGIPGTVGGAIYMNAGAHTGDMASIVENVTVMDIEGNMHVLHKDSCEFAYRHSVFQSSDYIIVSALLKLNSGDSASVYKKMAGNLEYRKEMQPLELPSVGSTFRNPQGHHAGQLIEECGLKGYRIGGAAVSEKHANFIVNIDEATAKDIIDLVSHVQKIVFDKTGVVLETEFEKVES